MATEYKAIAQGLGIKGIVSPEMSQLLVSMAGYRNRMVHLYHLVSNEEIYDLIQNHLADLRHFVRSIRDFIEKAHYNPD